MAVAEAKDKSSLTILSKIKGKLRVRKVASGDLASSHNLLITTNPQPPVEVPKGTVEFHIHKSLPDRNPIIVKSETAD